MLCEFCHGSGDDPTFHGDCPDCDGTGLATCSECGVTEDVVSAPDGPYYLCTDCLFVYLEEMET